MSRLIAGIICMVFYPENWNIESAYWYYLMVFRPAKWRRIKEVEDD